MNTTARGKKRRRKLHSCSMRFSVYLLCAVLQGCAFVQSTSEKRTAAIALLPVATPVDNVSMAQILLSDRSYRDRGRVAAAITQGLTNRSDPSLEELIAGPLYKEAHELLRAAARIRLVMQDPIIIGRIPDAKVVTQYSMLTPPYNRPVAGEGIAFTIQQGARRLAQDAWSTYFPPAFEAGVPLKGPLFLEADVQISPMLERLFSQPEFTRADLLQLSQSPVPEARVGAVRNLVDQTVIAKIAVEDKVASVRFAAVEKLADQALLGRIVVDDQDWTVRDCAAAKVKDQALLENIAVKDSVFYVRLAAVKKLTDQILLAKIAEKEEDQIVGCAAVERITDQTLLRNISKKAGDQFVRKAAVKKLPSEDVRRFEAEEKAASVRWQEVKYRVTDQEKLGQIAVEDVDNFVRDTAVQQLTNQALLSEISKKDKSSVVRVHAKSRLMDLRKVGH